MSDCPKCLEIPGYDLHTCGKAGEEPASSGNSELLAFSVMAGKYDGQGTNCKYAEDFATLDEAIAAYDTARDYHWCYLQYKGRVLNVLHKGFDMFES